MDYCYACRRHLNGAYSCPGCGTPADRLVAPGAAETAVLLSAGEAAEEQPPTGGRAARRQRGRQERAQRSRRGRQRAAVYGVGAVAVTGALAMFSMAALSGGGGGSRTPGPGLTDLSPLPPSGAPSADDAGAVTTAPGHPHASPSRSASASSVSPSAAPTTTATRTHVPVRPPVTATGTVRPGPTTAPPTTAAPSSPHPSPTATKCHQVLWWCQ